MIDNILTRTKTRLTGEEYNEEQLAEMVQLAIDRVCLRVSETEDGLSPTLYGICSDVAVKVFRRLMYEGINNENAANISTSFYEDALKEYGDDLKAYTDNRDRQSGTAGIVRFI